MRRRKRQLTTPAIKTAEQLAFESAWNAGNPQKEDPNVSPLTQSTSFNVQPPSNNSQSTSNSVSGGTAGTAVNVASILFGENSHDSSAENDGNKFQREFSNNSQSIPALESTFQEENLVNDKKGNDEVIVLDNEDNYQQHDSFNHDKEQLVHSKLPPPPLGIFRPKQRRNIISIDDILEEPKRISRPER